MKVKSWQCRSEETLNNPKQKDPRFTHPTGSLRGWSPTRKLFSASYVGFAKTDSCCIDEKSKIRVSCSLAIQPLWRKHAQLSDAMAIRAHGAGNCDIRIARIGQGRRSRPGRGRR